MTKLVVLLLVFMSVVSCSIDSIDENCPVVDNKYRDGAEYILEMNDYTKESVSETTYKNYSRGDEYCVN